MTPDFIIGAVLASRDLHPRVKAELLRIILEGNAERAGTMIRRTGTA